MKEGRNRRERQRAQLLSDVHDAALQQVAAGGPSALTIAGAARAVGVSPTALYHYFRSRDDLLAAIVSDSHAHLTARQLAAARDAARLGPVDRFRIIARESRNWCVENPHRYRLLFNAAPASLSDHAATITPIARRGLAVVLRAVADLGPSPSRSAPADDVVAAQVAAAFSEEDLGDVPDQVLLAGFLVHVRLLGIVNLEVAGVFEGSGIDLSQMYESEVERIIAELTAVAAVGDPRAAPATPAG